MKGFTRSETRLGLCGLRCGLCRMRLGGYCPGCGGGPGNQSCAIARCSLEHGGVAFCSACPEYPCSRYDGWEACDSFVSHQGCHRTLEQVQQQGLAAYLPQLERRMELLQELLEGFDDGRRKTLFSTAACLLELEALEAVLEGLRQLPAENSPRERAAEAAARLEQAAREQGVSLRLRKKPNLVGAEGAN